MNRRAGRSPDRPLISCLEKTMLSKKETALAGICTLLIAAGIAAVALYHKNSSPVLPVLQHPEASLRQVARPVGHIDDSVVSLGDALVATLQYRALVDLFMAQAMPRGLAAPQLGRSKRLIACGLRGAIKVMVNPVILERRGAYLDRDECMSVENGSATLIRRSAYVKVRYTTLANREETLVARNDDAALIEHEIDHLNGVLNIDY